jgi:hypothetical protein
MIFISCSLMPTCLHRLRLELTGVVVGITALTVVLTHIVRGMNMRVDIIIAIGLALLVAMAIAAFAERLW